METFRIYKDMEVTYAEFSRALKKLGFQNESTPTEYRYVNHSVNCIVKLPPKHPNSKVLKAYFASHSISLYYFEIIKDPHDLAKMIEKERLAATHKMAAA